METNNNETKTRIYNLIILDKSGSMSSIRKAAYEGCNEVLGGIRAAAEKHAEDQEQFVSLLLFDSNSMPYIHKFTPAKDAASLTEAEYEPCACTPLLDAMGMSLTELECETEKHEDAVGMVTIITDGYENASKEYTYSQIQALVGRLKQKGWNFAFMGANQDVNKVCVDLNINIGNAHAFSFDDAGMRESWENDLKAKEYYYERMASAKRAARGMCKESREKFYRAMNDEVSYFDCPSAPSTSDRVSPTLVTHLDTNEIFVFGSNAQGVHSGGAAAFAMHNFGAIRGQGEGLQGQSYAIPTMGTMEEMKEAIDRFTAFARQHQELKFIVTAIGCGVAGNTAKQVAPLFREASALSNVYLPQQFWDVLNARLTF